MASGSVLDFLHESTFGIAYKRHIISVFRWQCGMVNVGKLLLRK